MAAQGAARCGLGSAAGAPLAAARRARTPVAHYDALAQEIVFPWIAGTSGRDMLRREGPDPGGGTPAPESFLEICLLPLVRLHGTDPTGFDLRPFHARRRIDPRL